MLPVMEKDWQPYLDGEISMDEAVRRMAERLAADQPAVSATPG